MIFKDPMFDCLLLTLKVVSDYKTLSPDSGWASIAKRFQCAYVHALKPKEAMQMIQLHLFFLIQQLKKLTVYEKNSKQALKMIRSHS